MTVGFLLHTKNTGDHIIVDEAIRPCFWADFSQLLDKTPTGSPIVRQEGNRIGCVQISMKPEEKTVKRRDFLKMSAALTLIPATGFASEGQFEVTRTTAEWRALLTDFEFSVMREEATERAHTSPLNAEKRDGVFHCKGCELALYESKTKYESGTGWPSFYESLPDAVRTKEDNSFFSRRTEVHCRRCGSHLGHIFNDGPKPTGKRHCLNGVSLTFQPASVG